jgi:integrase
MKKDRHLPAGMYAKHGAFYLVKRNKWHRLGATLPEALAEYARRMNPTAGTLPDEIDAYLVKVKRTIAPNTYKTYANAGRKLKAALVEFSPADLKATTVAQLLDHYEHQPGIANQMRAVLRNVMDICVRHGKADANPVLSVKRFEEPKRGRYITDAEFWKIHAKASPTVRAIMRIQFLTGQRIGDVVKLKHAQLKGDGIEFRQQKTGKPLIVTAPGLKEAIAEARELYRVRHMSALFQNTRGGPLTYNRYGEYFTEAARLAGIVDARPNDLRAKSGSDAENQGVDPTALLGHDSPNTTKRYLRNRKAKVVQGPELKKGNG